MNEIYEMKLHDILTPKDSDTQIQRVPGGWIYTTYQTEQYTQVDGTWSENYRLSSVFVPFDNEFQESLKPITGK